MRESARWHSIWPLLALLGALAAFGLGALVGVAGPSRSQVWASHEHTTAALDGLVFHLRDAEAAQRDYLLSGAPADLARTRAAAARARQDGELLRRLAAGEPAQRRQVERLRRLVARRLADLETGISLRRDRARIVLGGGRRGELDTLRLLAADVRRGERRVLQARLAEADAGRQVVAFLSGGAGLLLFGLLPVALWLTRRSRRQLADAAQVLNQALEASEAAAWRWDSAGGRLTWSEHAAALLGVEPRRVGTVRGLLERVHPDDREALRQALEQARGGAREVRHEFRVVRPDGAVVWLAGSGRALPGEVRRMAGTLVDVSERRRAEQSLRFLAAAGTLLTGSLDYDQTLRNVARMVVETIADACFFDLAGEDGAPTRVAFAHRDPERQAELDTDPEGQDRLLRGLPPQSVITAPVASQGRTLGTLTFCRAGDAPHPYDADDRELAEELGRRAGAAVENARLYQETQRANAAKDQFLATLSHELRTPLTPVLAVVSALEEDRRVPDDVRDRLAMVRRNAELEARLIDDLLDLTRIERGKLDLHREVTDVLPLLAHALEAIRTPELEASGLRLTTQLGADDHRVWADGPRLSQVFWNLLKNAVKFTPAGGAVRVRSQNEGEPGAAERWLVVEVADTGMGIAPDVLPRIFDAFEQGQRKITRKFGGLGLGLAISRRIVELHGGTLAAASAGKGQGASFTVRLPVGVPAGVVVGPELLDETMGAAPPARPLHILLVEDHADTAEALAELLRGLGHRVTTAASVERALAAAATAARQGNGGGIDLVVSDLGLPDGSGYDLMRELAARYGLRGIALSGYGMEEDVRQSREAGFERHLTKPVDLRSLEAAIREPPQVPVP
ncbi:MAG TPA: ATP-binding protein [Thermoanaerobaculia bacterium]|nr:ATP-binding protein [Thermoanaerobaculia bacterium]